jgi:hypothetical protein
MFQIEEDKAIKGFSKRVIDHERGVWLQMISGLGPECNGNAMKLVWGERTIPFEVEYFRGGGIGGERVFNLMRFIEPFGGSLTALAYGVRPYDFKNLEELRQAKMLAVEAMLVFGSIYNGSKYGEDYFRFEFEGRVYFGKDFGI